MIAPKNTKARALGRALKLARLACGYSLRQAAEASGIDHSTIWRIEHGKAMARIDTIDALCDAYGEDPRRILAAARLI